MLLGTLLLALLNPVPPKAPAPAPVDMRAECMKSCAGAPKDSTGQTLLACLQRCEPTAPADAGVSARN